MIESTFIPGLVRLDIFTQNQIVLNGICEDTTELTEVNRLIR